jgi:hypothetical protein
VDVLFCFYLLDKSGSLLIKQGDLKRLEGEPFFTLKIGGLRKIFDKLLKKKAIV